MAIMLKLMASAAARRWLTVSLLVSALMLAIAHAFETFGGLAPCHLCLQQREAYWVAMGVAAVGLVASRFAPRVRTVALWLLALTFAVGCAIAVRHAGAEWKFWAAPQTCSGVGRASAADLAAMLNGAKLAPPRCDVAAWRFLGVSMAGYNALISLALAVLSGLAARPSTLTRN
jgi:disulfide bond formation protein DsbB